jgi:copper chaperone CopZ
MENIFHISGMTCMSCRKSLIGKINAIEDVLSVQVSLETGIAKIQSKNQLTSREISMLLGSKYSAQKSVSNSKRIKTSKLKQLTPLFLIFIYLIVGTLFLSYQLNANMERKMQIFMGMFFIVFSFFKFLDYEGFPNSFKRYDPLAKKIPAYAKLYPFLETVLGIAFLMEWYLPIIILFTLIILSITTFGVLRVLTQKSQIDCACLGTALKLPMTEATLIENGIMLTMAIVLLVGYIN